jgi:hypothetical protein
LSGAPDDVRPAEKPRGLIRGKPLQTNPFRGIPAPNAMGRIARMPLKDPVEFLRKLATMSASDVERECKAPDRLLMDRETVGGHRYDVAYAPFDHVNLSAKVVLIGITPGREQMKAALEAARSGMLMNLSDEEVLARAKVHASFSGSMRPKLVEMLDHVGLHTLLGIRSTSELWGGAAHLAHFTSALRYPVFRDGGNYNGSALPHMVPILKEHISVWFAREVTALRDAVFIPLGSTADKLVGRRLLELGVAEEQVLSGIYHPSGENGERVKHFLGQRTKAASVKLNVEKADAAKASIIRKIAALGAKRAA